MEEVRVEGVKINNCSNMYVGERQTATVSITPDDALNKNILWSSSNKNVATISSEGEIVAHINGNTTISVQTKDGNFVDSMNISVFDHTTAVSISNTSLQIKMGDKERLTAQTLPLGTSDGQITWSSSDDDIATVDENGNVKGIAKGTCTITATSVDGGYTKGCAVTVAQPVQSIQLEKHETNLKVGETEELRVQITPNDANNKNIKWTSEDETIATVNEEGVIAGVKSGKVRIYATSEENSEISDYCTVTFIQPVTGITLDKQIVELTSIGETIQLQATVLPEDAENKNIKWSSSNEKVCIVSGNGTIVGLSDGVAIIIATTEEGGFLATCQVTVNTASDMDCTTDNPAQINVEDNSVYITNKSPNVIVVIYSTVGEIIYKGYDDRVVLPNGIYIVKVGNLYHKIVL